MNKPMTPNRSTAGLVAVVALVTWLAGCASQPQKTNVPPAPDWNRPSTALSYVGSDGERASGPGADPAALPGNDAPGGGIRLDEGDDPAEQEALREEVIQVGSSDLFNRQAAARALPVPPTDGDVSFNFTDSPIQAVVQAILGDVYEANYIIAPGVGGTVTYVTQQPIRAEQAMGVLEYLLALNNASIVFKDGRYEILPVAAAVPGNISPRMGPIPTGRGYQVQIVPLRYIAPSEMQRLLTPFARPNAVVSADNARGILVLAGTREELQNYLRTVEIFDVDWLKGMSIGFYPLENAEVGEVMPELETLFVNPEGSPLAGMFRFLPVERLNAIFVITQNPDYLQEARAWLKRLDRTDASAAGSQLFVYDVKNVKAVDLADYLGAIFTGGGTPAGRSERSAPRANVGPGQEAVEVSSAGAGTEPRTSRRRQQSGTGGAGVTTTGDEEIGFTAVEENNQLLIRSSPTQYEAIMATIRKLDIVPLQVHIEAQIIEVSLDGRLEFGVQWFLEGLLGQGLDPNPNVGWHQPGNQQRWSFGGNRGAPFAPTGASFFYRFTNEELDVALRALDSEDEIRVLSAPSLTVLNNQEANINIGQQIPVVTTYFNPVNTGNTGSFNTSSVQFRDTGIILTVVPRVNPGGLVYMELSQEVSSPGAETVGTSGNVPINKRTIETQIAVQSGDTVLLGGLISEDNSQARSGVPGLSRIPIIGNLFGTTNRRNSRRELVVLITPRVIEGSRDAQAITNEYHENFRNLRPLDLRSGQPISGQTPAGAIDAIEQVPVSELEPEQ